MGHSGIIICYQTFCCVGVIFLFTLLSFEEKEKKSFPFSFGKGSVAETYTESGGITAKKITCVIKNGRINREKLLKKLDGEKLVVCDRERKSLLPAGVRCFSDRKLRERLCGNFAVAAAQRMSRENTNVKIGLFDPDGENSDLPAFLLDCTRNLTVVTYAPEIYSPCADMMLEEKGAVFSLSSNIGDLENCDFVIALEPIREKIYPKGNCVIISSDKPSVPLQCQCYWDYSVDVPEQYKRLRPKDVPEITFCGALFELCGVYELGSQIPLVCRNSTTAHTAASMGTYCANIESRHSAL